MFSSLFVINQLEMVLYLVLLENGKLTLEFVKNAILLEVTLKCAVPNLFQNIKRISIYFHIFIIYFLS